MAEILVIYDDFTNQNIMGLQKKFMTTAQLIACCRVYRPYSKAQLKTEIWGSKLSRNGLTGNMDDLHVSIVQGEKKIPVKRVKA